MTGGHRLTKKALYETTERLGFATGVLTADAAPDSRSRSEAHSGATGAACQAAPAKTSSAASGTSIGTKNPAGKR